MNDSKGDTGLTGRIAVVTGASSGVGRAVALGLAAQGADVYAVGRAVRSLETLVEEGRKCFGSVYPIFLDLAQVSEVVSVAHRLFDQVEKIDILIHSAAIYSLGSFEAAEIEDFDRQYKVNLRGPYLLTQALLPLVKRACGDVVFINSTVGLNACASVAQYAATKHGLRAVADSLRQEANSDGIRVLTVYLGRTATAMQKHIHEKEGKPYHPDRLIQPEDVAATIIHSVRLPRTAEITEISMRPLLKPVS